MRSRIVLVIKVVKSLFGQISVLMPKENLAYKQTFLKISYDKQKLLKLILHVWRPFYLAPNKMAASQLSSHRFPNIFVIMDF